LNPRRSRPTGLAQRIRAARERRRRIGRDPFLPWTDRRVDQPAEHLDGALRADTDAICPGCLQWLETGAYVRRNAYGLLEHEACPVRAARG
jgi:hypothetical protein